MEFNEKSYLRVTQVLSPFAGFKNIPSNILEAAQIRGTEVHNAIDSMIEQIPLIHIDHEYQGYIDSFKKFSYGLEYEPKIERLYCDVLNISGEIDAYTENDGKFKLIDFKTSVKYGKTWALQLAAYSYLLKKNGIEIHEAICVQLQKDGKYPIITKFDNKQINENLAKFLICLDIYKEFFMENDLDLNEL